MYAVCMQCVCSMYAVCMQYVCSVYAVCMQYVCSMYAVCVQYVCSMCAVCMQYVCSMYAVCMMYAPLSFFSSILTLYLLLQVLKQETLGQLCMRFLPMSLGQPCMVFSNVPNACLVPIMKDVAT